MYRAGLGLGGSGRERPGHRSGVRIDADGLFRIQKIQVRTDRTRSAFYVGEPPRRAYLAQPTVPEGMAARRRLAAPQAMTFTARGWGSPRRTAIFSLSFEIGFLRDFRDVHDSLPHKAYFDFLDKTTSSAAAKRNSVETPQEWPITYGDSPLAFFRTKP